MNEEGEQSTAQKLHWMSLIGGKDQGNGTLKK